MFVSISSLRFLVLPLLLLIFSERATATPGSQSNTLAASLPLCLPGEDPAGDCLHLGPVHYQQQLAEKGLILPPRPLPAHPADVELAKVPFYYAQVIRDNAPVFASLEEAIKGEPALRQIPAGFDYVTYIDATEAEGKRYYMIDQGVWMRGSDLSRISATSSFQGLEFHDTPRVQFGWVRNETEIQRSPGFGRQAGTGELLYRYELVQIYEIQQVDGADWYLVGLDRWVEGRQVGRVIPNPTPPQGVTGGRWIEVNLAEQTVAVYENSRLVFATLAATGKEGTWTRPGLFQVYKKVEAETMTTSDLSAFYYLEDVPWTVYFDQARALHGTFWHNRFGFPQSRGCVNLSPGDANWIFQWVQEGDWVYVWDPTGKTPTDPSYYGAGGA